MISYGVNEGLVIKREVFNAVTGGKRVISQRS